MRATRLAILPMLVALASSVGAQEAEVSLAKSATESWLAIQDSKDYASSWEQASSLLQSGVTQSDWIAALTKYRSPLGLVKSRQLKSAQYSRTLPAAPAGEYVVVQYETEFENGVRAVETITPHKEADQHWKVSGYYIK